MPDLVPRARSRCGERALDDVRTILRPDRTRSHGADVRGLRALLALLNLELHPLVLLQRPVPGRLDGAEVDEDVRRAAVGGDEAVPLLAVEPLHGALCHGGASPSVGADRRPTLCRPPGCRGVRRPTSERRTL